VKHLALIIIFLITFEAESAPNTFNTRKANQMEELMQVDSRLLVIWSYIVNWSIERKIVAEITSIYRKYPDGISTTLTHSQYRAIDFSTKNWTKKQMQEIFKDVTIVFRRWGAISSTTGMSTPIIFHRIKGGGYHGHIQVRPALIKSI